MVPDGRELAGCGFIAAQESVRHPPIGSDPDEPCGRMLMDTKGDQPRRKSA